MFLHQGGRLLFFLTLLLQIRVIASLIREFDFILPFLI
jgi:hypothetical protein